MGRLNTGGGAEVLSLFYIFVLFKYQFLSFSSTSALVKPNTLNDIHLKVHWSKLGQLPEHGNKPLFSL